MDVFSALQTSVSGLQAQAFSLGNISGNIANSQTVGYKRIDTDFADMLVEQPAKQQSAGGVAAFSQLTNSLQGGVTATGCPDQHGTQRDGFFTVQTAAATARRHADILGHQPLYPPRRFSRSIAAATSSTAPAPT